MYFLAPGVEVTLLEFRRYMLSMNTEPVDRTVLQGAKIVNRWEMLERFIINKRSGRLDWIRKTVAQRIR